MGERAFSAPGVKRSPRSNAPRRLRQQVMASREEVLQSIEAEASALVESGELSEWHARTPFSVRRVAGDVNGPMLERLARRINWPDVGVLDFFREVVKPRFHRAAPVSAGRARRPQGAPLAGELDETGVWALKPEQDHEPRMRGLFEGPCACAAAQRWPRRYTSCRRQ